MNNNYHQIDYQQVVQRLINDYGFRQTPKHLTMGRCPECGKKELFTHKDRPWSIKCNRTTKCGFEETIKDLYPDLYEHFTKKYPSTEDDPNLTAKQYLSIGRGFDVTKLEGWYEQGLIHDPQANITTATVKFFLNKEKTIYWERLIDYTNHFSKKARFIGKFGGMHWQPPSLKHIDPQRPLYLVEGIFDAISLHAAGFQVVSIMTSHNYPANLISSLPTEQQLIWALDNNKSGIDFAKKYHKTTQELGFDSHMAIPDHVKDWNDIYIMRGVEAMHEVMNQALWNGARLQTNSASEAAAIYVCQTRKPYRIFQKNNAYWEAKFDLKELERMIGDKDDPEILNGFFKRDTLELLRDDTFIKQIKSTISMEKLSNCIAKFEYQQVDQYNDESRLNHFKISYENGAKDSVISIPGTALSDAGTFNTALLKNTPGARFTGKKNHIEFLHEQLWFKKPAKEVKTLNFAGYDKISKAYVFNEYAFYKGKKLKINDRGFFELEHHTSIKTVNKDIKLNISDNFNAQQFLTDFVGAYSERGIIVLAWWVGSLFAEQLRDKFQGYPFLELQGQASSGKSTLIKILWKLVGREGYEGFNPLNSSFSAIDRNFAKTSNLPVILIESDANDQQRNAKKFNWEHLKNAYTGEPLKERGVQNAGNETVFNPFRGTLMASQNTAIEGSEAILSRFIHLPLDRTHHTQNSKFHAEKLINTKTSELSGFLPFILKNEKELLEKIISQHKYYYDSMSQTSIKIDRIKDNHALIMSIIEALCSYFPIDTDLAVKAIEVLSQRAVKRQLDTQTDHPSVQELWDIYEYINVYQGKNDHYTKEIINHSTQQNHIAINLVHFEQVCKEKGLKTPDMQEIKRHIKQTNKYRFKAYKTIRSNITNKSIRCYIFEDITKSS